MASFASVFVPSRSGTAARARRGPDAGEHEYADTVPEQPLKLLRGRERGNSAVPIAVPRTVVPPTRAAIASTWRVRIGGLP